MGKEKLRRERTRKVVEEMEQKYKCANVSVAKHADVGTTREKNVGEEERLDSVP